MKTIAQGAEAKIIQINDNTLKKFRLPKPYRLEIIDNKIRKFRNKREFKVLLKLKESKVNVPNPIELTDFKQYNETSFTFEFLKGDLLKKKLNENNLNLAFKEIIKMHNCNITHGDLTTLNMIELNNKIYLIDFGLSLFSHKTEDKAVDLNLFFTCVKNEHPKYFKFKEDLIKTYLKKANNSEKIIQRLKNIEHRGRNK